MISVNEVTKRTGVTSVTLQRYRDMGMIAYPVIDYQGGRKHAYYPEETVSIVEFIEKKKAEGYKLHQIRDMLHEKKKDK